jgi:hypothetical protein
LHAAQVRLDVVFDDTGIIRVGGGLDGRFGRAGQPAIEILTDAHPLRLNGCPGGHLVEHLAELLLHGLFGLAEDRPPFALAPAVVTGATPADKFRMISVVTKARARATGS